MEGVQRSGAACTDLTAFPDGKDAPVAAMQHPVAVSSELFRTNQKQAEMDGTTLAVDLAKCVFGIAVANERDQIIGRNQFGSPSFMSYRYALVVN